MFKESSVLCIGVEPYSGVLVLAGMEFIFFTVASMGLWFGFVLETVMITQGCLRYC